MQKERVIIIGSGPAGLAAAIYIARATLNPLVLTGAQVGGQISLTSEVENYPGLFNPAQTPTGPDMVELMQQQAAHFGTRFAFEEVTEVELRQGPPFTVKTHANIYQADAVLVTAGASPKHLGVSGEAEYVGRGVSYCGTCDGFFFRGKEVVVVGGGDSALEESIFLTKFATKVTVVHRRNELRAGATLQNRAFANPKIHFLWDSAVEAIEGNGVVNCVQLRNLKTGERREMAADGVFVFIGHYPNSQFLVGQLAMDEHGYVITDEFMRTSVTGVYAAGEIQDPHYRQIATSVGQGVSAAMQLERWISAQE